MLHQHSAASIRFAADVFAAMLTQTNRQQYLIAGGDQIDVALQSWMRVLANQMQLFCGSEPLNFICRLATTRPRANHLADVSTSYRQVRHSILMHSRPTVVLHRCKCSRQHPLLCKVLEGA